MTDAMIVDSDAGTDPDDTCVAIRIARNAHLAPTLLVSNDETVSAAKARFLAHTLALCGRADLPVAAGLPSNKQRTTDLADTAGLVPDIAVARDAVARIAEVLDTHTTVDYIDLGALTNLDAVLARRPELASRVRLCQMGPAIHGGFTRKRAQYNARIDPGAFWRVLERVPLPTLVATHTTWGAPASRPPLGVFPDDTFGRALAASPRPELALYARHLAAFVASGKDCSILHDPATLLASREPGLFDFVELDIAFDDDGWLHLTAGAVAALRALPAQRTACVAQAVASFRACGHAPVVRARVSLDAHYPRIRARIVELLGL